MKDEVLSEKIRQSDKIRQSKLYYWCAKIIPRSILLSFALEPLVGENHSLLSAIYTIVAFVLVLIDAGSLIYFSKKGLIYKDFYQDVIEMTKADLPICAIGIAIGIYLKDTPQCIFMLLCAAFVLTDYLLNRVNKLKD